MIEMLIRWRTWIVNVLASVLLVVPVVLEAFAGFDWGLVLPPQYVPLVAVFVALVNIWMRPRPAVRAHDPEVEYQRERRREANPWDYQ
jgi:hypothetical protein